MTSLTALTDEVLAAQIPLRHSVRNFTDKPIEGEIRQALEAFIADCNAKSGLSLQLVTNEPQAFSGMLASYGKFSNVRNYIACIGPEGKDLQEQVGFCGERCVLAAQALGLNSCWVALTYSKRKVAATIKPGQKLVAVIALGYGTTAGTARKSKTASQVTQVEGSAPESFYQGVEAALLAPTAMNQQKFLITYHNGQTTFKNLGGPYSEIDLGIVRANFELGAAS